MDKLEGLLHRTSTMLYRQADQALQERLGIGMSQYKILQLLHEASDIQQRTLADTLQQTEASISRQIKLLTDKGLLIQQINPRSRRERLTALTPKGVRLAVAADEVLRNQHQRLFAGLGSKQQEVLVSTLTQLVDGDAQ